MLLALAVPAATGSSSALAQASSVTISPTQGPPGTEVTATGSGWTAGDEIEAIWDGPTGTDVGSPVVVGSGGGFTLTFPVPAGAAQGSYQVAFYDQSSRYFVVANEDFTVTQSPAPSAPPAPYDVKVVPYGALDFLVTWSDSAPTFGMDFQVYNGVTIQDVGTTIPYQYLWAAQPNQYNCFAVRAYNSSGYSAWAGMWTCATTPPGGQPTAPANVVATGVSSTAIEISFVNQADNETAFLFYNGVTTREWDDDADTPAKGSSFSILWTGLQPHTWMCFKVAAYNQWGDSGYVPSTWACAWTQS
jgi:hypothetical protein